MDTQPKSVVPDEIPGESNRPFVQPPRARSARGQLLVVGLLSATLGGSGVFLAMRHQAHTHDAQAVVPVATPAKKAPLYQCPMHPSVTSDHPGDCPICGMALVKVEDKVGEAPAAEGGGSPHSTGAGAEPAGMASVTIDPARQQMIGLKTVAVTKGAVTGGWTTVGKVQVDPTRVRRINVKVEGFVERVFVDFVGRPVRKGEPLFSIYSPSLLAAQNELLLALKTQGALKDHGALAANGDDLVASARRKLQLWDVPAIEIERLEKTGEPAKALTLVSPISGVVTVKNVVEGARLGPGDIPYEITDLGMVWVMADAYESDVGKVKVGMPASMTMQAYPGKVWSGRVAFLEPLMDPKTRTLKVHLHFPNPGGILKPEMFGEVTLQGKPKNGLSIPLDAVIRSGERDVVFLALGEGKFRPQEVKLGTRSGEQVEIVDGLMQGQEVVTRASFLIDSESRLKASLAAIAGK